MRCIHCNHNNLDALFLVPVEGGRAYAQTCEACGRIIGLRPNVAGDPPATPPDLSDAQIARLEFVRWLRRDDLQAETDGGDPDENEPHEEQQSVA